MEKKVRIYYYLNEEGRKKSLLAGGDGKREQVLEADITPELVAMATVNSDGNAFISVKSVATKPEVRIEGVYDFSAYHLDLEDHFFRSRKPRIVVNRGDKNVYFDEPQTVESILAFLAAQDKQKSKWEAEVEQLQRELEKELPEKIARWEAAVQKHKAKKAARDEQLAAEKAAKVQAEAEKTAWIKEHGSDYLKRATKLQYNCQRQYVLERAAMEHPGFVVDFDNEAEWRSRSCPSMEALEEVETLVEKGVNAEVVWLTHPPYEFEDYREQEEWEAREAIVITGYLEKYNLVKEL